MNKKNQTRRICVGQFAGAHGVRGLVKLRSFTAEPEAIFTYAPLTSENGDRVFKLTLKSPAKDGFVAGVEGIPDKESADLLRGDKLYVARDLLPKTSTGEYYEADLIGLKASDSQGKEYGKVLDVHDHGAGVFLEIGSSKKDSFMLPFKDSFVPSVNFDDESILIIVPEG
jgi:16S rRNA processing protein RimM